MPPRYYTDEQRDRAFFAKTEVQNGCLVWVAANNGNGYGVFSVRKKRVYAHRFAYERWVGPIPTGEEVDHLCRNRSCVYTGHLEAVSHWENLARGEDPRAKALRSNHCQRGHDFSVWAYFEGGRRRCRKCRNMRALARYHAKKILKGGGP